MLTHTTPTVYLTASKRLKPLLTKSHFLENLRNIHTTCACSRFYESHRKGEYHEKEFEEKIRQNQRKNLWGLKDGWKDLRTEIHKWKDEFMGTFDDSKMWAMPGDREEIWKLNSKESLEQFVVQSDRENNEGFSNCDFSLSPTGKGLFQGYINTTPPKDGRVKYAGYCSIKTIQPMLSFARKTHFDWSSYTHLVMRVRGDGRSYIINIGTPGQYDLTWNDVYSYVLYTRGGPYFQRVKIPFTRFVFSSKGRLQDHQNDLLLDRIASIGISAGKVDGPFSLEIDYIGVECDPVKVEKSPYEMYRVDKYIVNV